MYNAMHGITTTRDSLVVVTKVSIVLEYSWQVTVVMNEMF